MTTNCCRKFDCEVSWCVQR